MKGGVLLGEEFDDWVAVPLYGGPYGGEFRAVPTTELGANLVEFGVVVGAPGGGPELKPVSAFYRWELRPVLVYAGGEVV